MWIGSQDKQLRVVLLNYGAGAEVARACREIGLLMQGYMSE